MGRRLPYGETVTILRMAPPVFPTLGNKTTPAVASTIDGCAFWPTTTAELIFGQDTVTWDASALLPPDTDIEATDQVQVRGQLYDVVGQPQFWRNNFTGREPGYLVQLKAASG